MLIAGCAYILYYIGGARRISHVITPTNGVDFLITAAVLYRLGTRVVTPELFGDYRTQPKMHGK